MGQFPSIINVQVRYKTKDVNVIQSVPFACDGSTLNETNLDVKDITSFVFMSIFYLLLLYILLDFSF